MYVIVQMNTLERDMHYTLLLLILTEWNIMDITKGIFEDRPKTAAELGIMQGFPPIAEARPGPDNWDLPPFNRWSFQNMRMLFPTVAVASGEAAFGFDRKEADFSSLSCIDDSGKAWSFDAFLRASYTDGLLIYYKDRIRYEGYFNGMTVETLHLAQSVSKTVVGTVAGILAGRGLLDLAAPVANYIPELSGSGYGDAILRQVLDMQSGVRFTEDYDTPGSDMTRIDIASGWRPVPAGMRYETITDVIKSLPKIRPHGSVFDYRSIETDMLAWILERVTGQSLAELVSTEIWKKMGAEHDANFVVDRAGTALADGGFSASLRDFARFGRLYLDAGKAFGPDIVPMAWIKDCRAGDAAKFGTPPSDDALHRAYRNKWWIRHLGRGDIVARGVFGQMIYVDRTSDLMVVKLSTWPDYTSVTQTKLAYRMIDAIRDHLEQL